MLRNFYHNIGVIDLFILRASENTYVRWGDRRPSEKDQSLFGVRLVFSGSFGKKYFTYCRRGGQFVSEKYLGTNGNMAHTEMGGIVS